MFAPPPNNEGRKRLRKECREALASHIESRTGFRIPPYEVRLSPSKAAPYWWKILRLEAEQLFLKPLSRCNVGDYRNIISHLGDGFEACPNISNPGPTEQITPENGTANKEENEDGTMARVNYVAPMEEARYAENIRQFEHDVVVYQSRIDELEKRVTEADERILSQETQIFQFELMIGRLGQILHEYQHNSQTYEFV